MFLLKLLFLLAVGLISTDGIFDIDKNVTEECCILPPILNDIKRSKCLTALGISPNSTDDSLENECLLQCMMDNVLRNNTLDKTTLFKFVKNQIVFPLQNIWERPIAAAVDSCSNEVNGNPNILTPNSDNSSQSCPIAYSYIIGCIFQKLSLNCPYISLNSTDERCANLTNVILNN